MERTGMDSDKRKPKPIPNERLRYYRKMRFWSQSDLADQLYSMCSEGEESERGIISTNMVSRWELGEIPSSFWRKKLCELFGQDSVELGFLKPPEQPVPVPARASVEEQ